MLPDRFWFAAA